MEDPKKTEQELEENAQTLKEVAEAEETAKTEEIKAEENLEKKTAERLEKTFVTHESLDEQPEPSKESDDSTPNKEEKSAEKSDDGDGPTAAEKEEEAKLEAEAKVGEEKGKEADVKAKDEDAQIDKNKKKETPPLSDGYVRAAIHRGWTEEEVKEAYEANPELTVRTLGKIYEAVNRSSKEYAAFGRVQKEQAAAKVIPEKKEEAEKKSEFKGVDIEKLRKEYPDDPVIELVETMQTQNKALFDEIKEFKTTRPTPAIDQPSGLSAVQIRATEQEAAAIEQQIETYFKSDTVKGYEDFYGALPKDAIDWSSLTPGQKMNRWTVIEMMDQMIIGASTLGREMKIDEALNLSHLSVTESIREKVIRNDIKSKITKRSSNLTLKPSGTAQPGDTKAKTMADVVVNAEERLRKMNW